MFAFFPGKGHHELFFTPTLLPLNALIMTSIFTVFVHRGFRGACEFLMSRQETITKQPRKPQVRFVRVRNAKKKRGTIYQVVGKGRDHHRRTVRRYKKVDNGSMIRDTDGPDEWVTVRGKSNHEEKKSARPDKEDRTKEPKDKKPKQRKKLEKKPKSSKSGRDATSSRKIPIEQVKHSKPRRQKQNVKDTWSTTHGTIVSQSVGPQSDLTPSRNDDTDQGPNRRLLRDQAAAPIGSELSGYSSRTRQRTVRIVETRIAEKDDAEPGCLDVVTSRQKPSGPFQQPDMSNSQSQSLIFGPYIN
jgi:hypothetical protein